MSELDMVAALVSVLLMLLPFGMVVLVTKR